MRTMWQESVMEQLENRTLRMVLMRLLWSAVSCMLYSTTTDEYGTTTKHDHPISYFANY